MGLGLGLQWPVVGVGERAMDGDEYLHRSIFFCSLVLFDRRSSLDLLSCQNLLLVCYQESRVPSGYEWCIKVDQ
jgi:hypothetical protein